MTRKPIIAAIPNYNMARGLGPLLGQLTEQQDPYDHIYVLDDASTDGSQDVVKPFGDSVTFVKGKENHGSGANRNRILSTLNDLGRTATVHFLDADVELDRDPQTSAVINPVPVIARELLYRRTKTAFVGGLVKDKQGKQLAMNHGPLYSLQTQVSGLLQLASYNRLSMRERFAKQLHGFPDLDIGPLAQPVYWTHEANMLIDSGVLARLGGFDDRLRDHDIQPIARQAKRQGFTSYFNPSFAVTHHALRVRSGSRFLKQRGADLQLIRHHYGLRDFLLPDGHYQSPRPSTSSNED